MIALEPRLGEERQAAGRHIRRRRVEQRAMIGERNVVQVIMCVIRVERAPAAIFRLHADNPVGGEAQRILIGQWVGPVERHGNNGGIVDVGVEIVAVLEGPAARCDIFCPTGPVAPDIGDLGVAEPGRGLVHGLARRRFAGLHERQHRKTRVPDRRQAGLTPGLVVFFDQELADRLAGDGVIGVIVGITKGPEGHDAICHGRENAAETVLAVETPGDETYRFVDGAAAEPFREHRLDPAQYHVESEERIAELCAGVVDQIPAFFFRRRFEQFADVDFVRVRGARLFRHQDQKRHDHRARPVRYSQNVERRPARQQHDADWHDRDGAPRHLFEQGERDAGEHVGMGGAAMGQNGVARAHHMGVFRAVSGELQRVIRLDAGAHVEIAVVKQRPAMVAVGLDPAQIGGELGFAVGFGFAEEMIQ